MKPNNRVNQRKVPAVRTPLTRSSASHRKVQQDYFDDQFSLVSNDDNEMQHWVEHLPSSEVPNRFAPVAQQRFHQMEPIQEMPHQFPLDPHPQLVQGQPQQAVHSSNQQVALQETVASYDEPFDFINLAEPGLGYIHFIGGHRRFGVRLTKSKHGVRACIAKFESRTNQPGATAGRLRLSLTIQELEGLAGRVADILEEAKHF